MNRPHGNTQGGTVSLVMGANYEAPHYAVCLFPTFSLLPVSRNICIYSQNPSPEHVRFVCAFYNWGPIFKKYENYRIL